MLDSIYRLNRWYDGLDEEHGALRFLLCLIPMMAFVLMVNLGNAPIRYVGLFGLTALTLVRVFPVFFPRR
jgi:hypothetical protein